MTSYSNVCDVTVADSNHKNCCSIDLKGSATHGGQCVSWCYNSQVTIFEHKITLQTL